MCMLGVLVCPPPADVPPFLRAPSKAIRKAATRKGWAVFCFHAAVSVSSPPVARSSMKRETLSVENKRLPRFFPRSRIEAVRIFPAAASS